MQVRLFFINLAIIGLILLALPLDTQWLLPCPFHQLTGWECPFCGTQRMMQSLLHAEWRLAFSFNPFVMCSLPFGIIGFVRYLFPNSSKLHSPLLKKLYCDQTLFIYLMLASIWGIFRNLYY